MAPVRRSYSSGKLDTAEVRLCDGVGKMRRWMRPRSSTNETDIFSTIRPLSIEALRLIFHACPDVIWTPLRVRMLPEPGAKMSSRSGDPWIVQVSGELCRSTRLSFFQFDNGS
jgi:hypothetical protein